MELALDVNSHLRNDTDPLTEIKTLNVSTEPSALRNIVRKEVGLLAGLLFFGLVLMPVAIFWIGQNLFGSYGGNGYGEFFGTISAKIRSGDRVAWFLVLAPYLVWQCLRLMVRAWRGAGRIS